MLRNGAFGAIVAVIAALTAIWSSYEAHLSRLEDERPYVKVEYAAMASEPDLRGTPNPSRLGFGDGSAPHIKLTIFGKTPALNISIDSDCSGGLTVYNSLHTSNDISYGMLFPGESAESHCLRYISTLQDPKPITISEYWGVIHYLDIDGHHHQTPFCFTHDQLQEQITHCDTYTAHEDFK